jgi:glycine/D-amino acid oxidase-like deaminating enzyme
VCFYPNATDGHFMIGQLAGRPWETIVGALSGHGFKFAAALGDIAADIALDGGTPLPIGPFDPGRFAQRPATAPPS